MVKSGLDFRENLRINRFSILLSADDDRITSAVSDLIDPDIAHIHDSDASPPKDNLEMEFLTIYDSREMPVIPDSDPQGIFEDISFYSIDGNTLINIGGISTITVDRDSGYAMSYVGERHRDSPWVLSHRIFYIPFLELLSSRDAFHLHAGCVSKGGKGILISGGSGKGKSTLTYSLARAGCSYISDDAVFLQAQEGRTKGRLEAFAFPEKIKLGGKSRSFFNEFERFSGIDEKIEIPLSDTGIEKISASCSPEVILFPSISDNGSCGMEPVSAAEAIITIIRQSVSLTGKSNIQKHMDILKGLCEECKSYRVVLGRDMGETVAMVKSELGA